MKIKKLIPKFIIKTYHFLLAFAGAVFYRFPSRKLKVIGITGTKGKSTTVLLAGKILEEADFKVGWISSASIKVGDREWLNPYHMTMPGRFVIQRLMNQMVKEKCQYCLIEVTSEGIVQNRHKFISFQTAVFLNLRPEHIEAHGSFENYRAAKLRLFKEARKSHIVNLDDENARLFSELPADKKIGFTMNEQKRDKEIKVIYYSLLPAPGKGVSFKVEDKIFNLNLIGSFNASNALAAISIGFSEGIVLDICKRALEKTTQMPGRMEVIKDKPFKVIVDLAHTPDSYQEVFRAVKALSCSRIITVMGAAGGGRDKWKRPVLGKTAAENSDIIILTNEDSYEENPGQILSEIKAGITKERFSESNLFEVLDRREAIRKALAMAKENDVVLILGKGTEQLMVVGDKKIPWDDRKIAHEELERLA